MQGAICGRQIISGHMNPGFLLASSFRGAVAFVQVGWEKKFKVLHTF